MREKEEEEEDGEAKQAKVWNLTLGMELGIELYGYMFVGCGL